MPEKPTFLTRRWSFLYLVQERHLSALEGGWLAMLPPIGAAVGAWLGGGNLGGVINISIIAWLSGHGHWHSAFATGTAFAVVAAALWLLIDADRQLETGSASQLIGTQRDILAID
jgi:sugar phosphate permease